MALETIKYKLYVHKLTGRGCQRGEQDVRRKRKKMELHTNKEIYLIEGSKVGNCLSIILNLDIEIIGNYLVRSVAIHLRINIKQYPQ